MADFINTIDAFGDAPVVDSIIDRSITEFKDDRIVDIGQCAFYACVGLKNVDFPNALTVGNNAFGSYRNHGMTLETVNLPKVTTVNPRAFETYSNAALPTIYLPEASDVKNNSFSMCWGLRHAILPKMTKLNQQAFSECSNAKIVLPQDFVVTLATAQWFPSTVYVPANLLDQYVSATNWSAIAEAGRLFAIEDNEEVLEKLDEVGYEYTPTTAGG